MFTAATSAGGRQRQPGKGVAGLLIGSQQNAEPPYHCTDHCSIDAGYLNAAACQAFVDDGSAGITANLNILHLITVMIPMERPLAA